MFLPNPNFLNWLLDVVESAKDSVVIVNYLAALDKDDKNGPVAKIAGKLAVAARRGVKVRAVLEGSKFRENYAFYRALKNAGADIWMDTSLTFIHTKAVLVDGKTLCIGSHNLSDSALTRHEEASLITTDAGAIKKFMIELNKMTAQQKQISADVCREGTMLAIPSLVKIKRATAPYEYLLYLLLCKLDGGKGKHIDVDEKVLAAELKLPESTASSSARIRTMLAMMDKKLGVVKYYAKNSRVVPLLCKEGKGEADHPSAILLPSTFWQYRWHTRLSDDAIHLYLAGEAEKLSSPFAPWWRLKRDEIASRYGFQKQLVNRAQTELKKFDLLEILYETAQGVKEGRYVRYMNYFRQNPFYDYDARMAQINSAAKFYPAATANLAHKLAALVCEDSDASKFSQLCNLISKHGRAKAKSALQTITRLAPNSTKRKFEYVEERLEMP